MTENNVHYQSPYRWLGGKTGMSATIHSYIPDTTKTYYEPFCGSAAVFAYRPHNPSVLSDTNKSLITTFCHIAESEENASKVADEAQEEMLRIHRDNNHFYQLRDEFNYCDLSDHRLAVVFTAINRSCIFGMYRVNSQGIFNTPLGKMPKKPRIINKDELINFSRVLRDNADVRLASYTDISPSPGDTIYCDPPYDKTANPYSAHKIFDQEALRDYLMDYYHSGVNVIVSSPYTEYIADLYRDLDVHIVPTTQRIVNKSSTITRNSEYIITGIHPEDPSHS